MSEQISIHIEQHTDTPEYGTGRHVLVTVEHPDGRKWSALDPDSDELLAELGEPLATEIRAKAATVEAAVSMVRPVNSGKHNHDR